MTARAPHRGAHPRLRRIERTWRVWRLTIRNGVRFVLHRVRRQFAGEVRRTELDDAFTLRTADDVARELGNMKGALMKAGQLISFVVESLPEAAQQSLSSLYSDAPPMSDELAASVVRDELGRSPSEVFLDWSPSPVAAASIGQVHRAVTRDGREVAVKVQYPGVGEAIEADLANADVLYRMVGAFTLKGLDTRALVDELRTRMRDELDYRIEAANVRELRGRFAGHPFVSLPEVIEPLSTRRVLTSEWIDGWSWNEFIERATPAARQRAGESIWRFAQHAIHRLGVFNGDPHPGNYRFSPDGDVTFLDFGMVKRWAPGEWELLAPSMDAIIVDRDPDRLLHTMERSGFLPSGHGLSAAAVYDYVEQPVSSVPRRHVLVRPVVHARHHRADHRRERPARRRDRHDQHARLVPDARPRRVGDHRTARQARTDRAMAGDAARVPDGRLRRPRRSASSSSPGAPESDKFVIFWSRARAGRSVVRSAPVRPSPHREREGMDGAPGAAVAADLLGQRCAADEPLSIACATSGWPPSCAPSPSVSSAR